MDHNCRISTRRNVRQSAPCQEINNIFNAFKLELKNVVQGDSSFLKKLPTTHKTTCQMIERMPQIHFPSKENEFTYLQNMKKMMHLQEYLLKKQLFSQEQCKIIQELSVFQELEVQNQQQFQRMKKRLIQQDPQGKQKKENKTKDIEEMLVQEDVILMDDKIRRQLDKYLTMN